MKYRGVVVCTPNKGDTLSFWDDLINGNIYSSTLPHLFHYAKNSKSSFWKLRTTNDLLGCFNLPMSRQAHNEFLLLQHELEQLQPVTNDSKDEWVFIWRQSKYSSSRYYQHHFANEIPHPAFTWMWKSKCVPKIKFFTWPVLNDRLNTRSMLKRRHKFLEEGYNSALCHDNREEIIEHLLFSCPFTATRWFALGIYWREDGNIFERLHAAKQRFPLPFLHGSGHDWCLVHME